MNKYKKVLITGHTGQLGSFLAEICCKEGLEVHGLNSTNIVVNCANNEQIAQCSLLSSTEVKQLILNERYDIIFNLAALTSVGKSWEQPNISLELNTNAVLNILEAMKDVSPATRLFQASSSEAYALKEGYDISENSPFSPSSPYGVSKAAASMLINLYREKFALQVINGVLFANESSRRPDHFVTKKIIKFLLNYSKKREGLIELGNISLGRDFGHAAEYASLIYKIMLSQTIKDVVLATGKIITLKEFFDEACEILNISLVWSGSKDNLHAIDKQTGRIFMRTSKLFYRPNEKPIPPADTTTLTNYYRLSATLSGRSLVQALIEEECS